jgi:hypothetical protein
MKKGLAAVAAIAALSLLSACATPTPYQPAAGASKSSRGYTDTRIEDGRYRLSFSGNDLTSRETVENYMLFRAAELTLQEGYDWFEVIDRGTDQKTRTVTTWDNDPFYGGLSWRFYRGGRWGRWGYYGGFSDWDRETYQTTRYEATAEILMHKGAKPDGQANAYDARSVVANLEGKIIRPQPAQ